jgi:hypothetical protein
MKHKISKALLIFILIRIYNELFFKWLRLLFGKNLPRVDKYDKNSEVKLNMNSELKLKINLIRKYFRLLIKQSGGLHNCVGLFLFIEIVIRRRTFYDYGYVSVSQIVC